MLNRTKTWLPALFLALLLAGAHRTIAQEARPCDMAKVVKAPYCETDKCFLAKQDIATKAKETACGGCGKAAAKEGTCKACGGTVATRDFVKGTCKQCSKTPIKADACVKVTYRCAKCSSPARKPGKCGDCKGKVEAHEDLALVVYKCEGCETVGVAKDKCANDDCDRKGKALSRSCASAGTPPHVGAPKAPKGSKRAEK